MAQEQDQKYLVKINFTDEKGKQWTAGSVFTGEAEAVRKLLAAGKIEERRDASQPQPKE